MRRISFASGELYHIYNRGVDKRTIFESTADFIRFLKGICFLNDQDYYTKQSVTKYPSKYRTPGRPLISLKAFCLMPNHFHLLIQQVAENGVSKFMQRLANSYTKYFNKKSERSGHLLEGAYKIKPVNTDAYLLNLSKYIHLNPKDLGENPETFPWSSYSHYLKGNRLPFLDTSEVLKSFKDSKDYKKFVDGSDTTPDVVF